MCTQGVDVEFAVEWAEPVIGAEEDGDVGASFFDKLSDVLIESAVEVEDFFADLFVVGAGGF